MKFNAKIEAKPQFDAGTGERLSDHIVSWICDENGNHVAILFDRRPEHETERRILAAAPEMLEALRSLKEKLNISPHELNPQSREQLSEAMDIVVVALAKAEAE